jgi:hypothetical protein
MMFLAEWALRSAILIAAGAVLLWLFRIKDPAVRLAGWITMLAGSLAIPAMMTLLPHWQLPAVHAPGPAAEVLHLAPVALTTTLPAAALRTFDWAGAALLLYLLVAVFLLLRLGTGLALSGGMARSSKATGRKVEGAEVRESDRVASPVTIGIVRPVIVLPSDWRVWDACKLEAVLAHEGAHIRRRDPAAQLLSALHRALLWFSPLSWFLHREMVCAAEEASDDAAVAAIRDRATYAETLLAFMQRGVRWQGIAMARYGRPERRILRILDGAGSSCRVLTRWTVVGLVALGSPLAYVIAAAHQPDAIIDAVSAEPPDMPAPIQTPAAPVRRYLIAATRQPGAATEAVSAARPDAPASAPQTETPAAPIRRYLVVDGDSTSGSWDSDDSIGIEGLRDRFGRHFLWFRQDRKEYVVTDAGMLDELRRAMEPQREVNRMQSRVNGQQAAVNAHQSRVNQAQSSVNAMQGDVNQRQRAVNGEGSNTGQADVNRRQAAVNQEQSKVNAMQAEVNAEQGKVNQEQGKVNEQQHRVTEEINRRLPEIINSAVRRNLAQLLM